MISRSFVWYDLFLSLCNISSSIFPFSFCFMITAITLTDWPRMKMLIFFGRYQLQRDFLSLTGILFSQNSMRLLVLWVLPCFILKSAREVIRILYVRHESWWHSVAILFALILSWTCVTTIFLSACILFHVVCNLQIIHFEEYGKLLEREHDCLVLIQEHARLRFYLSKISHRFRIYLLLLFLIVTISQFVTLFQTTEYNGMITFINGGDFAVSSNLHGTFPFCWTSLSECWFLISNFNKSNCLTVTITDFLAKDKYALQSQILNLILLLHFLGNI